MSPERLSILLSLGLSFSAGLGHAAGVHVRSRSADPAQTLFPSDRFTVFDPAQNTGRRVNLPKPSCSERPSDCADIDVINTLDGFNLQPRLSIPFDGPIDPATVSSRTVFLVSLGSTRPGGRPLGHVVGINQVVWDPATLTLYAESDALLDQHTRYLLVVTSGIRDLEGDPVGGDESLRPELAALAARGMGARRARVVALSLFTTQSATSTLEKVRRQIKASEPAPADFALAAGGRPTVFAAAQVAGIRFDRQIGIGRFFPVPVPVAALAVAPGAVGRLAFGRYLSPDYESEPGLIPTTASRRGRPAVQREAEVIFTLFLPSGTPPAQGWPVAIYGHGFGDSMNGTPYTVAASLAAVGVATMAINVVGHGGGPDGTLTVALTNGDSLTFPAGGRAVDVNGDGLFDATEGVSALPPHEILGGRDGLQQTVIDLMQLVREIEIGVDADGDGRADLDPSRVYYFGQSFGGIYGTMLLAVEPAVHAGAANVAGGSLPEVLRLGGFRPLLTAALAGRTPSLLNRPSGFDEELPLRNQPPRVVSVPGAPPIQQVLENMEWVQQAANPAAYAPHLRASPLAGLRPKSVLFQLAKGDATVPNPTNTAILRAGALADRATFFRNDLAFAADPTVPKNPHSFLTRIFVPSAAAVALGAQRQIATFFATDGATIVDPDGPGALFEVPIVPPLPEELNFIP